MKSFANIIKNILPVILIFALVCFGIFFKQKALADEALPSEKMSQWQSLTDEDKDRLRGAYRRWKDLSSDEKQKLQENFKEFKSLSEKEQQRLTDNYYLFIDMDPVQRKVILKRYQKWIKLTPEQKARLKKRYDMLINMHPEEQAKFYDNYETWKRLTADKKKELFKEWGSLSVEQQNAVLNKYKKAFSPERRQEMREFFKKIREKKLERRKQRFGQDKTDAGRAR